MNDQKTGPLDRISVAIEYAAGVLLGLVTLLIVVSAVGRYLLAWPVPDAFDLSRFFIGAAIMWGFASVGYRGSHIKVDLFAEMLPSRARRLVDAFAWAVLLLFTLLLTWKLFERTASAARSGEATFDLRLPAWIFLGLIWVGVAVSILTILARLIIILRGRGGLDHFESAEIAEADSHRKDA